MEAAMKNKNKKLMTRQRSLNRCILGNGNLWAGQRSSLVGHLRRPFVQQIKDRRRNMRQTVYISHNGRLETINDDKTICRAIRASEIPVALRAPSVSPDVENRILSSKAEVIASKKHPPG
jgi:hypothetical protein